MKIVLVDNSIALPGSRHPWALAQEYAERGHDVILFGPEQSLPVRGGLYRGVRITSFSSTRASRVQAQLRLARQCWKEQPDVVHLHGWDHWWLSWLLKHFLRQTQVLRTVTNLPSKRQLRHLQRWPRIITTSSRELQYKLLVGYGIRATYVPDGYNPPTLPQVPTKRWGLTSGRYTVIMAEAPKTVRSVLKQLKGRSTVVVLHEKKGSWKRLANEFPRLNCVGSLRGRSRQSVLSGALQVVLADDTTETETLLKTMAAGVPVSSVPVVRYQELLGTTARFSQLKELSVVVNEAKTLLARRGRAAAKRAQQHFTWERSAADYLQLAAPNRVVVPLDSLQPAEATSWQKRVLWA